MIAFIHCGAIDMLRRARLDRSIRGVQMACSRELMGSFFVGNGSVSFLPGL